MNQYKSWAEFPLDYREDAVATILDWVTLGESGVVVGASGTGKSNIAGYLATRPDVQKQHLSNDKDRYLFRLLDLNAPTGSNALNLYLGMLGELKSVVGEYLDLQALIAAAFAVQDNRYTIFMLYQALREAHSVVNHQLGLHMIWVLDRFDDACTKLDAETLNSLRSLRDQYKDTLSFIVFTRRPLAQLRSPTEYDEFHELMIMHTCWVGAMDESDGQWIAQQITDRHGATLQNDDVKTLYAICGGWPALLKLAYTALADGKLSMEEKCEPLIEKLLAEPPIYRNCQELWDSHTDVEQDVLLSLARCETDPNCEEPMVDERICNELEQYDLLRCTDDKWNFVSPLFAAYVRTQSIDSIIGIRIVNGIVYRDGQTLSKKNSPAPLEYKLLACFLGEAGYVEESSRVFSHDELIMAVWMDDSRTEIDLNNLIRNLRRKINNNGHNYIPNLRGRGYQFVQPK